MRIDTRKNRARIDTREDRQRAVRMCVVEGCTRRAWSGLGCSVCYKAKRRVAGERSQDDGGRVVYMHPSGVPQFGTVPIERRCRGCRCWATHFFKMGTESARQARNRKRIASGGAIGNGHPACMECIRLWRSFGRSGTVIPIVEAA